jgi:ubiquinone/menaquinone biosynthesis C-methylase UbiE
MGILLSVMPADSVSERAQAQKAAIVASWDGMAGRWDSMATFVDAWMAPVSEAMLRRLELKQGARVLELASGSGGFTRYLAGAVGPTGHVEATDGGAQMVQLAEGNLRAAGFTNTSVRVMDGERPDLPAASVDAVACRQAWMFFPNPVGALRESHRTLRPGGTISMSVFSTPARNAFLTRPAGILARWANPNPPPPDPNEPPGPGPFSLGEPKKLEELLTTAAFVDVGSEHLNCPLRTRDVDELLWFYRGILSGVVRDLPPAEQEKAWAEVGRACAEFAGPSSPGAPCEYVVASGRRPA